MADALSLTLLQQQAMGTTTQLGALALSILNARVGDVISQVPFVTRQVLSGTGMRPGPAPTITWRKLNADPPVTNPTVSPRAEAAFTIGNAIDTEIKLQRVEGQLVDQRATRLRIYLRTAVRSLNRVFLMGDPTVLADADAMPGLRYRLLNAAEFGLSSACKIDGSGVNISDAGVSAGEQAELLAKIDELLDCVGDGEDGRTVLWMNGNVKRRLARAARATNAWGTQADTLGRQVETYGNALVYDIGRQEDDATDILGNAESADGLTLTGGARASIYAARFTGPDGSGLFGWQFDPMDASIRDFPLDNGVSTRTVVDWTAGIMPNHNRCVGWLHGLQVA